jgi:hypothetical protein
MRRPQSAESVLRKSQDHQPERVRASPCLARIRERPAYEQIRTHSREIEKLKSEF